MAKKARILIDNKIDGVEYVCNQVVEFADAQAKALEKDGLIDTTKEAVAYCIGEGAQVLVHDTTTAPVELAAPPAEAAAAAQG